MNREEGKKKKIGWDKKKKEGNKRWRRTKGN